jgi:hypothetical protein
MCRGELADRLTADAAQVEHAVVLTHDPNTPHREQRRQRIGLGRAHPHEAA